MPMLVLSVICLIAYLVPGVLLAQEARPRSMLVLDQSESRGPFYYDIFSALRSTVLAHLGPPITIYSENLNLGRFAGPSYKAGLQQTFHEKYLEKPIGVVVAIGSASLDYVLRTRSTLWPDVPVVFSMVDETTASQLLPSHGVTGSIMRLRFADTLTTARTVVPNLKTIALVGDPWENQTIYRNWKDEVSIAAIGVDIIDLMGLTMRELRHRVGSLPGDTAIIYTSIYSDGEGTFYPPGDALELVAKSANRPIVIASEAFLGRGGIGGFLMIPRLIGTEAARLALRILDGEPESNIPVTGGNQLRPIFDWRQIQRWGVNVSSLPPGSEIRFRDLTAWDQYKAQILAIIAAILLQASLISWLMHERQYRRRAQNAARETMSELTQLNRMSTAGELSATIAHEVNQPLTGIVTRASAARRWLSEKNPDVGKVTAALDQIVEAGHRASDVVTSVRSMFKKDTRKNIQSTLIS